jgi:hypothetical protein
MKFRFAVTMAVVSLACWQPAALAQVNEKFADMSDEIAAARSVAQSDRKTIVDGAMILTNEQSTAFWPVYNGYRAEVMKVTDKLVKVVTDYAAQRDTLSDAQAEALVQDYLKFEEELLSLRKSYVKKFGAAIPMTKVARFYQIENKLDALQRVGLASEIPLTR